ncbi:hypothetical protein [Azospirillum canadense]|uniref:hypothetical protein n=1 Tax=Azospirillum canadense TaxID=403962 RepID=UPI002225E7E4|nr:hypothetical protein [Azospirillum canadense]MCW2243551.1 hypothetical protein [Azospirillum canadense]
MHLAHWNTPTVSAHARSVASALLATVLIALLAVAAYWLALELLGLFTIENTHSLIMTPVHQR